MNIELAITAWTGMTVRNILHGPLGSRLAQKFDLTIFSYYGESLAQTLPLSQNEILFKKVANPRWNLPSLRGQFQNILETWEYYAIWQRHHLDGLIHTDRHRQTAPMQFFVNQFFGKITGILNQNFDTDWFRDIAYSIPVQSNHPDRHRLLVATTDLAKDKSLLYSYKKRKLPIYALVHSWDNLICRGRIVANPDKLFLWNNVMADEAIKFHDIRPDSIEIVGGPQYEYYRRLGYSTSRMSLNERLNIPHGVHIITYACSALWTFPGEPLLIEQLVQSVTEEKFGESILVLRLHPSDDYSHHYITKYGDGVVPVRLDQPDAGFAAENRQLIGDQESIVNFVELMKHSDVVINIASTISLDAAIFDTPVICPKFNINLPDDAWNSAENIYRTDNYIPVINSAGVDFPTSERELNTAISNALKHPERLAKGRTKLVNELVPDLPTSQLICQSIENHNI